MGASRRLQSSGRLFYRAIILLTLVVLLLALAAEQGDAVSATRESQAWESKVDPWVLTNATQNGQTEFLVFLAEQADLEGAAHIPSRSERADFVVQQLRETALRTQRPLLAALEKMDVTYRSFWVANMIWIRGDTDTLQQLARRPDVAHIYANPKVALDLPPAEQASTTLQSQTVAWNIGRVRAPEVWAHGATGDGIVIGGQDTGYDWEHPALINQYRGWNGSEADHNYNWHDAIHEGGGICGADASAPCDDRNHGTHTMGIMVGDDGGENQIGMAPDARWIGCRNMDNGVGTPATYTECFQWFMAPTDLAGENPDVTQAPHIVNNSWSCPPSEGCTDPAALETVVQNVQAAGIVVVAAAGNSGPSCATVANPPAIYEETFSVGATDSSDTIAVFSSRGPVSVDGSNRLKPDVVAPGMSIRSSVPDDGYGYMQGTSMASPHVAGLVALLLSADPALQGDVAKIKALTVDTALPRTTAQTCGDVDGSVVPNNTYGAGRIDALAAYEKAMPDPVEEPSYTYFFPVWKEEPIKP
ncbi:MAG: S8 family serine peptidase [Chloroflexota bacterium]